MGSSPHRPPRRWEQRFRTREPPESVAVIRLEHQASPGLGCFSGVPRKLEIRWKRWLVVALLVLLGAAVYAWPARRNFYGKLGDLDVRRDVAYAAPSTDPKQQLDLYLPRARANFPLLLFVHGGYWTPLDRRLFQPVLGTHGNLGQALAHRGIGAAIIGYRQYPQVKSGRDSLDDIARAVAFAAQNAKSWGADPWRIFLMGHSAGGHLVSLLAADPTIFERNGLSADSVAGFISVDGIFDLQASLAYFEPEQADVMRTLFGPTPEDLARNSTLLQLKEGHSPLLIVESTGDEPVCREGFKALRAKFQGKDARTEFLELPGLGHNEMIVRAGMTDDPLTPLIARFVTRISEQASQALY